MFLWKCRVIKILLFFCCKLFQLFATPWTAAHQVSLPYTISQSLLRLTSIELVMPSNRLILYLPFPMSQLFSSGGQNIKASASVLPMNIQGWLPLGLTGLISSQSEGLSRVFSIPHFESISSSVLKLLYGPILTTVCDSWKNYSFD